MKSSTRRQSMNKPGAVTMMLACMSFAALAVQGNIARAEEPAKATIKSESFDHDPSWEGHNNRIVVKKMPTVRQDFGYSSTGFAGKAPGEMGGLVARASEPAYYADKIGPRTLDDKLSASGTFAITNTTSG